MAAAPPECRLSHYEPLLQEAEPVAFRAARANDVEVFRMIGDVKLWQQGKDGQFAVHIAAASNCLPALAFLLGTPSAAKHGGIEATDNKKLTPLGHAVKAKSFEAVVWLVRHGANLKHRDMWGAYVTHAAAVEGSTSLIALLGNLGADLNEPDPGGWKGTPLEIAAERGNLELTEYLVLQLGGFDQDSLKEVARARVSKSSRNYWLRRVLTQQVGCHETTPGKTWFCGPTFLGSCCCCGFPLLGLRCSGPEQVEVGYVHTSILSGLTAILIGTSVLCGMLPQRSTQVLPICEIIFALITFAFYGYGISAGSGIIPVTELFKAQYAEALDAAAAVTEDSVSVGPTWWGSVRGPMVHQLAAVAPERAKYCTATRQIVPLYDHYCKYMRSPIGRDNYPYFLGIITMASLTALTSVDVLLSVVTTKNDLALGTTLILWIICSWYIFTGVAFLVLFLAHIRLIAKGLTTWEQIQILRSIPAHLFDPVSKEFQNPYNRGFIRNFKDRVLLGRVIEVAVASDIENEPQMSSP